MILKRCVAFLFDWAFALFLAMFLELIVGLFVTDHLLKIALISMSYAYIYVKDSFTGRGLGKMAMNLSVVNAKNGEVASSKATLVRNIFTILWPIELLVLIIAKRRLGDMVAETDVVEGDITHEFSMESIAFTIFIWVVFVGLIWLASKAFMFQ
jgi:hypothetical protein